jgi:perosamine synthetase
MATYLYDIFQNRSAFPGSEFPFVSRDLGSNIAYPKGSCPRAELAFEQTFNLNISEFYTTGDIDDMIGAAEKVAQYYRVKNA